MPLKGFHATMQTLLISSFKACSQSDCLDTGWYNDEGCEECMYPWLNVVIVI